MWGDVQLGCRWLTDCDPAFPCWYHGSLVLRLLPHVIGRGKHFLCSGSSFYSIRQRQVEYIWSRKTSLGAPLAQVPIFRVVALTDRQCSCCSSWCACLCVTTAHTVLNTMQNRYWPLWFILWKLVGGYPSLLARHSFQPCRTAYFSPAYSEQVRNPRCSGLERHSRPSPDVRFAMFPL